MIIEDCNTCEETPEFFSDSILQMRNELKSSPLYPEAKPKKTNTKTKEKIIDNVTNVEPVNENNSFNFISEVSPGNLIPYNEDIEKRLNDLSCSSSVSDIMNENKLSLDPDYNLLDYSNKDVQTLQDEIDAFVYSEESNSLNTNTLEKEITPKCPDKPSQVLFPENDCSLESLLLMLKVPPTQDAFQLIVQNAMGNDLPVSQKVFLTLENNGYTTNFPPTVYNHLQRRLNENQCIIGTASSNSTAPSTPTATRGVLSSQNSNKVIIQNHYPSNDDANSIENNSFQNYRFGNDHEANASSPYFSQCRTKEDRERLQQYQKQKRRASTDFMDLVSQVPYWVDWNKISRGQEVFWKYGLPLWISITLYAMTKGAILPLPDPLNSSSHPTNEKESKPPKKKEGVDLLPAYLETSQIIIESMMENSLRPGGMAWKSLIQIRCRHAQFRVEYVDHSFNLKELHDYLRDGVKYYEKKNKKKNKPKESYQLDPDGNLQYIPKSKPEVKSDVKIIEFAYPNTTNNQFEDRLLLTDSAHNKKSRNKKASMMNEDELEIEFLKSNTNTMKKKKSKTIQNKVSNYYPTPSSSPIPNQRKTKKNSKGAAKPTIEEELPPIQKEVIALPTELLDSIFPINQVSLAKTILYLSIGSIKAMERTFGISMSKEEQEDYLLVWRYISWICGLEDKRGKNYGNKIITPKYAEIAINYFLEKDPLVSWDNELVCHAQSVIKSLALTLPILGTTALMKSIVNEISRKFTYFTSMPIPKEMSYSINISLPNHKVKVFTFPYISYIMQWLFHPIKRLEDTSEYDRSFDTIKKKYYRDFDGLPSKGKSRFREESTTSTASSSQTYNKYKKKVERNMEVIHGKKSYLSSGMATLFIVFIRFLNNIFGLTDIGVYIMSRIHQTLLPKLIWIANSYQWVDFSRRKLN
ncbi:hypothetical protein BCR36DRAFT_343120 [Piromyces finnis]|uniref:ER-bound oxygenase mpaB/mpaB'/Rubber oxygenase catalytic domain-containing protein n=1 Tax=Piromyces finnis TaxID=1754191 RepID=A0A1Y1VLA1_9FUNG|nr:hypothetical protein BCR36DRAFT_343120 [Piromyces finnis]|eukprot:ORX59249.1 hypothetical protein BCR36DRAFT_343120 [Piromyces finnis]